MKKFFAAVVATGVAISTGSFAMANHHAEGMDKAKMEVVEKNARGQATKVKMGERVYDVCMSDAQDSCINPREAGLNWGNRALSYWPGKPASEM